MSVQSETCVLCGGSAAHRTLVGPVCADCWRLGAPESAPAYFDHFDPETQREWSREWKRREKARRR